MTPLGTSLSTNCHSNPIEPYDINNTPANMTLVSRWDESQFDLDLADDSIIIGSSEKQPTQKQRFKKKLRATVNTTHQHRHSNDHPRTSWTSTSSSRSSLHSTKSLSISGLSQISYTKLSSPFIHLKHIFQKD